MGTSNTRPCLILAGQWRMKGTRCPPSKVTYLVPRNGLAYSFAVGPLSEVKMTMVCRRFPRLQRLHHLADAPIQLLNHIAAHPVLRRALEHLAGSVRRVRVIVRVVQEEGLISLLADDLRDTPCVKLRQSIKGRAGENLLLAVEESSANGQSCRACRSSCRILAPKDGTRVPYPNATCRP